MSSPNNNDHPHGLPNLDASWSISEASFKFISNLILEAGYQTMVEFGSGLSTARWLSAIPELRITSIEHDRQFFLQTKQSLEQLELNQRCQLYHAPLQKYWLNGRRFHSYGKLTLPSSCDIVIIDGPPHFTRRGREACLYCVYDSLKIGGIVILDDARREDEQVTVANWLSVYPDSFSHTFVDIGNGLSILKKNREILYCTSSQVMKDFYRLTLLRAKFSVKVFLKTKWKHLVTSYTDHAS